MAGFIIRFRWLIIAVSFLTCIFFASLIPSAETDPEIRNYIPENLGSRINTDRIEKEFGVQDMVIVLFQDSCILEDKRLNSIRRISRDLSDLQGISRIVSPFNIKTIKGEEGMMIAEPLIRKSTGEDRELITRRISENKFAASTVFSEDLTTAAITATINGSENESVILGRIDSVISSSGEGMEIKAGGLPYIRRHIMKDVRRDAVLIIPAALLIMLFILKLTLGSWRSVFMPFSVVVLSTGLSIGLVPLMGWKISIISLLVPVILVAVANNYGIYLVARHQELRRSWDGTGRGLIFRLTGSLNTPILFSGLTTVAGTLGLLTHSVIPARQVGILSSAGVAVALLMSVTMIPAMLYIGGNGKTVREDVSSAGKRYAWMLEQLSAFIIRNPGRIVTGSLLFTILMSSGILLLRIDTNQENYFPHNHPVRAASGVINEKFGGSQTLSVMLEGDIVEPSVMKRIDTLTMSAELKEGVGRVYSVSKVIREMSKAIFMPGEKGYDKIPDSREGIAQLFELYNMSGDQGDFDHLINTDYTKAHILIRLSRPENRLVNDLHRYIELNTSGIDAEVTVGGYAIIMTEFAESVIRGQISSLVFAVLTVFILLAIIFRSVKGGLVGIIPLAASILVLFGFMGFSGIELDAATALISSIMVGVGVDFTIQYMWCYNSQLVSGSTPSAATAGAVRTIGRSIIINGVSVMAGFSALMFSGFTSIRFFGYLVLISIGSCLVGALVVIPAFLLKFRPRFIGKEISGKIFRKNEKQNNLIPAATAAFSGAGSGS